ncbi:MAG: hypothetical protein BWY41_00124 [Candidatus Atribacteria bacterium ADurb.Bin276]|uniref:Uncharacterized protein n=1 Tax=Candidatus Atribacter allofermentans TaxID=1852833 RepID=A0A1V5T4A0_9BACT|nr:MAG: hypothetical protein BWY41_00124 [Candidatus Atribacteria bacterium ADurb.Bin276]
MKYLVLNDCPNLYIGEVVETSHSGCSVGDEIAKYKPEKLPKYFVPMWFEFGDKIRMQKWLPGRYFIPMRYERTGSFTGKDENGTRRVEFGCNNKDLGWEFYEEDLKDIKE